MERRVVMLSLLAAVVCALSASPTRAIDASCSACEAVAAELQRRLDAELPIKQLDLRHRLDKDGVRYGKIVNYRVSELRAVELLDGLCGAMEDYTLVSADGGSDGSGGGGGSEGPGPAAAEAGQQAWVKHRGEGSTKVPKGNRPSKAEEELRVKQLKTFCGLIIEDHEDELTEAITTDRFAKTGVAPVLCREVTSRCRGKEYAGRHNPNYRAAAAGAPAAPAAAAAGDVESEAEL